MVSRRRTSRLGFVRHLSVDRIALVGFVLLVVFFPLFFGGNRPWVWGAFAAALGLLAMSIGFTLLAGRSKPSAPVLAAFWPTVLITGWLLVGLLQWLPMLLISDANPIAGGFGPLSSDPGASLAAWVRQTSYALVFLLAIQLLRGHRRIKLMLYAVIAMGLFEASSGAFAVLFDYGHRSTWFFLGQQEAASGTFVNRNHLAGYLLMSIALGMGLIVSQLKNEVDYTSWRQRVRDWVQLALSAKVRLRLVLVVMVIGLVLTRSRMGNLAFFVSLLVSGVLALWLLRKPPRMLAWFIASVVAIDLIVVGSWFGLDQVVERLNQTRLVQSTAAPLTSLNIDMQPMSTVQSSAAALVETDRVEVALATLTMWQSAPWMGVGGGAFRSAFPPLRSESTSNAFYDHAHNDWVQTLAEYGVLGAGCFFALVFASLWAALFSLRRRHDRFQHGLAFGALMGITALMIHAAADFNLQIPANAALFWLLMALAWISVFDNQRPSHTRRTGMHKLPLAFAAMLATASAHASVPSCEFNGSSYLLPKADVFALGSDIARLRARLGNATTPKAEQEQIRDTLAKIALHALLAADRQDAVGNSDAALASRKQIALALGDTKWRITGWAQRGDRDAIRAAAEFVRHGLGSAVDERAACAWVKQLPAPFNADEAYRLAQCLRSEDPAGALKYMQLAAKNAHPAAAETLGLLCLRADQSDVECALNWLCRAGAAGRIGASAYAAFLLTDERLRTPDYVMAERLYRSAAEAGDVASQNNLGELYEHGRTGVADIGRAELWYTRAAETGNARAQLNLARVMLSQLTVKPWKRKDAIYWLRAAAVEFPAEVAVLEERFDLRIP